MDRIQPALLATATPYVQANVTVGEFIDHIEPHCGADAAQRLRWLLKGYMDCPMPTRDETPIPQSGDEED